MSVPTQVVVLLVIIGAGVAVLIGWAITNQFQPSQGARDLSGFSNGDYSQAQYQRELRLRHQDEIASSMGGRRAMVRHCHVVETGSLS